ncbi:lipolytic enzyme [Pseudoalteromonas sp. MMG013]|uniref:Lipolytic enzyme n=1 Tax=Pseudoalteromonas aurantia 208 TaxID=1314867 RepID=A0ABR9EIY0_9GAMM|nr:MULTISPECIES: SGNH/GDSL hydrolase family protein [Pseudoalteromonas]MBE0370947.1 hypothetical protein [Pseudoalteromonas aurantia 208]MBQ4864241.1 lipolytic enzyme [Pseudoalteromonas sp. MMG013]
MYKVISSLLALGIAATVQAQSLQATHYAVQYEGRIVKSYDSGQVQFNWPGSYFKTKLIGRSIDIELTGYGDQFDILVNGRFHKKIVTDYSGQPQSFELFSQETASEVLVEVVKRTENYDEFATIHSFNVDGRLEGVWQNQKHILYIGDSISAGFGSESNKRQCTWSEVVETSNARLAFPYVTSKALNTSFTQVSFSGLGLIRNWAGNQTHHDLAYYYDRAGGVYGTNKLYQDTYPDLIVVEVGTNDFSTDPQPHEPWDDITQVQQAWVDEMVSFVGTLRSRYPDRTIVFMPRPAYPYDVIISSTEQAIKRLQQQGESNLYSHSFNSQLSGCIWHPTKAEHQQIASELVKFIHDKELL